MRRALQLTEHQVVAMFIVRKGKALERGGLARHIEEAHRRRPDLINISNAEVMFNHDEPRYLHASLTPLGRSYLKLKCGAKV